MTEAKARVLLKRIRKELGWSWYKIGDEIGVAHSTALRWASGFSSIRKNNIKAIHSLAEREGVRV